MENKQLNAHELVFLARAKAMTVAQLKIAEEIADHAKLGPEHLPVLLQTLATNYATLRGS